MRLLLPLLPRSETQMHDRSRAWVGMQMGASVDKKQRGVPEGASPD
jgi:hypothetical protein